MPLNDSKIRALKPSARATKHGDGGSLLPLVSPKGGKLWRMDFRFDGKQKQLAFGAWPSVGLAEAREHRDAARKLLASGIDPAANTKMQRAAVRAASENTFGAIAAEFLDKNRREGKAEATLTKKHWLLGLVGSAIASTPIMEIKASDILVAPRLVEALGNFETARRLRAIIGQVFRYAIATSRAENDPTYGLKGALVTPTAKHMAAATTWGAFSALVRAVWAYSGTPETRTALRLMVLLYPRPGELRKAKWSEFDLENATWLIPAERMKTRRPHKKPLAPVALEILREIQLVTGNRRLVFPSYQNPERPLSENTMNAALRRMGFGGDEVTSHGFRASASTLLNESGLWSPDAVEAELSHIGADEVRRTYHRGTHWAERIRMAEWWAERIEGILSGIL